MNKETAVSENKIELSLVLKLDLIEYQLDGSYADNSLNVSYSKPITEAIDLGSVSYGLKALGAVLLGKESGEQLLRDITAFIETLPDMFKNVINAFLKARIKITKLEIMTNGADSKVHYGLGLGLLFTEKISVGGIVLEYFAFEYRGTSGSKAFMNSLEG